MLAQWLLLTLSLHPAVQPLRAASAEQTKADAKVMDKKVEELFSYILTDGCRREPLDALKYEGPPAMRASFQSLIRVAMHELTTERHVARMGTKMGEYFKADDKLKALFGEAGVPQASPK